ncbi:unnamed protein product [Mycena citricolor]|uniref:L-2-hydroxyglutarate dehydrogenase, mitochondrial n=1 Tax=Mycena citricolor TaxID=2018698 RepID=A0AAD2Q0H0_9AGAR|nr:unnamed protein product [Mycena citricolor]
MSVRAIISSLNHKHAFKAPESAVDFLVVGAGMKLIRSRGVQAHQLAGVVGLAIGRELCQKFPDKSTIVVERHPVAGEETSSRNSEVIHSAQAIAGLYYPPHSLKTRLCIRGRELLYAYCDAHNVPHRKLGKLVVATKAQQPYIAALHEKALSLRHWPSDSRSAKPDAPAVPTALISGDQAREMEPNLSDSISGALWSPETGIIDSHAFMGSLEKDITESGGDLAYSSDVVRVDRDEDRCGWVVQVITGDSSDSLFVKTLVNAAGLSAPLITNTLLPPSERLKMYFAKGSYAKYRGPGVTGISHLIYPCPETQGSSHGFQSLGTHLTLDLQGNVRFGPDLEWLSPQDGEGPDFWSQHLTANNIQLQEMHQAVTRYLPKVILDGLQPDYVGFRPKLAGPTGGFQDFVIRTDFARGGPLVSLLGIESPGLTSSLAIAEHVVEHSLGLDTSSIR